jgi:uncharacterized membrane protein YdbT with pleckstrin-like domain
MASDASPDQPEEGVLLLRPHWKVLAGPAFIALVVIAVALTLIAVIPAGPAAGTERLVVLIAALLALIMWVVTPVLRWRTTMYELTTARLRIREGIITRRGRDIPLARVSDVSFARGILDRLLGAGRVMVESAGEHGQIVLRDVPDVERVQATLFALVEEEQRRLAGNGR